MVERFSYKEYAIIMDTIRKYLPIVDYKDVIDKNLDKYCVIRHDIEFSMERAYKLAKVEKEIGVQSTYNIQLRNNNYNALSDKNIELAKKIYELGHHIGAHVHVEYWKKYIHFPELLSGFVYEDARILRHFLIVPVDRFVFHRPTSDLLKDCVRAYKLINLFDKPFFNYFEGERPIDLDVYYFSDSNHSWKYGHPLKEDLFKINKLQLLCHPYSWTETGYNNYYNFLSLIPEKNKEIKESMKAEMVSFPEELL